MDVDIAHPAAIAALDNSFFRVRFDRLTPSEKRYLRAMADLGRGHTARPPPRLCRKKVVVLRPGACRARGQGHDLHVGYGQTAYTVPLFDAFMRRAMP